LDSGLSLKAHDLDIADASPRQLARIAGALYLIVIVGGFFAQGFVSAALVVPGDAAATVRNVDGNELLYRSGLVAHVVILLCNIPLAVIFYELFKVVDRRIALLVAFLTLVGTAIEGATLIQQFAVLLFLGDARYLSAFTPEQLQALAYMPLQLQEIGFTIGLVFFGSYGLSLGYLVFNSTFLSRILGVLLAIGGSCYLINSFLIFLTPEFASKLFPYILLPSLVGEGSFCLTLLLVGLNARRWEERARAGGFRTSTGATRTALGSSEAG